MIEQCNLLDQLTRGKCVIGLGPGSMPHEFDAFGRDVQQRDTLFEQTMAAVLKMWHFEHGDKPFEFETLAEKGYIDRSINPSSYRKPTPILARATFSGGIMEDMGTHGWPLFVGTWRRQTKRPSATSTASSSGWESKCARRGTFLRDLDEKESSLRSFRLFIDEVLPRFQSGPRDPYVARDDSVVR